MPTDFRAPASVVHQGKGVYVTSEYDATQDQYAYWYNVLDLEVDSDSDTSDWNGYQKLTLPAQISPAGMSLVRNDLTPKTTASVQLLSDQQYVYLLRSTDRALYINRYLLVAVPNTRTQGDLNYELRPAWEVRYQRSGNANVPASDKDTLGFLNMENQPFYEPVLELPFGGAEDLKLGEGAFTVLFTPTTQDNQLRWQFFLLNGTTGRLQTYSFTRSTTGWFHFRNDQIDQKTGRLLPDAELNLVQPDKTAWTVIGPPSGTIYLKQESFTTSNAENLKAKRSARALLTGEARNSTGETGLATLDFAVASDGQLAFLSPGPPENRVRTFELGGVESAGYTLDFDGAARVVIPTTPSGLVIQGPFTLEGWVWPTATDVDPHGIIGGAPDTPPEKRPPSLYMTDKLRVGIAFGDGTNPYSTPTKNNVLTANAWNHVAASFDGKTAAIYVNGVSVELEDPNIFNGKTPCATPITAIGGGNYPFRGTIDEVKVWDTQYSPEIAKYLYREIPDDIAKGLTNLIGYWRMDEGHGTITNDISNGNRNASLYGATWVASTSPVQPATQPVLSIDPQGLTLFTGVILPHEDQPYFGNIKSGSRPFLLNSADGQVHLYYQGGSKVFESIPPPTDQFLVAHYDTTMERAYYTFPWVATAADAGRTQKGQTLLLARQVGAALNHATITVGPGAASLSKWTLNNGNGAVETWEGVPRRLNSALTVLTGGAVQEPTDQRLKTGDRIFFDYQGGRNLGYVPQGDPLYQGNLLFISRNRDAFYLKEVAVTATGDSRTIRLQVEVDTNSGLLVRTLTKVKPNVVAFVQTLDGNNSDYTYDGPGSMEPGDTRAYGINAGSVELLIFIPDPAITAAEFKISKASNGDPNHCDVSITLTPQPGTATWTNVPRALNDFIATLLASKNDPQKAVVGKLRLYNPGGALPGQDLVSDGTTNTDAGSDAFIGFFTILNDGISPAVDVAPFDLTLGKFQKASATGQTADLTHGSNLFALVAQTLPDNGYPAQLDLTASTATLFKPGIDGGWLAEPTRDAVSLSGEGEGLEANLATYVGANPLSISGDFTLEAWANVAVPPAGTIGQQVDFPRILQAGMEAIDGTERADPDKPSYMLGLTPTYALQFVKGVSVSVSDASVGDDLQALRLFPGSDYTIQFYINPNLGTISSPNNLWVKTASSGPSESLRLDATGTLSYTGPGGTGNSNEKLTSKQWSQVTLTRTGDIVRVYVGLNKVMEITAPIPAANHHTFGMGGQDLEMQVNQVAIWTYALTATDIAAQYMHLLPGDAQHLNLLWRLDDLNATMRVSNSAVETGPLYDTTVNQPVSPAFWAHPGLFYRAFVTSHRVGVETRDPVVSPGDWTHLAAIYDAHYGLHFSRGQYADCGNDATFDMQDAISIEAWLQQDPSAPGNKQVLLSKFGADAAQKSYEFGLDALNRPYITVRILGEKLPSGASVSETKQLHTFTAPLPLARGTGHYLAGTVEIVAIDDAAKGKPVYSVVGQVYVDGKPILNGPTRPECPPEAMDTQETFALSVYGGIGSGRYPKGQKVIISPTMPSFFTKWRGQTDIAGMNVDSPINTITMPDKDVAITAIGVFDGLSIASSDTAVNLGRSQSAGQSSFLGTLSDTRIWNTALKAADIKEAYASKQSPPADQGLVSAWSFDQQQGSVAYDEHGENNARLSSSDLWVTTHFNSTLSLLRNGTSVVTRALNYGSVGGYGERQLRFGTMTDDNGAVANPFEGVLDELRVWDSLRTHEQITDNMNRYLKGNEPHLAGYWRFDAGSGRTVVDATGKGNNTVFMDIGNAVPQWVESTAPVSDEAPPVRNALGGPLTPQTAKIEEGPSVFEYADAQRDANGELFSVMKRAYIYRTAEELVPLTGYKVGDLKQIYLGQVQTKPTLIGYIEGAPPLPSENLTISPGGDYTSYYGAASVTLSDTDTQTVTLTSSREDGRHVAFGMKFGLEGDNDNYAGVVAIGPTVLNKMTTYSFNAGVAFGLNWSDSSSTGAGVGAGSSSSGLNTLANRGVWETPNPTAYLNGQRRFLPMNEGYALVKSSTADVYSMHLASTGAMVGISVIPNLNIPQDINILFFPINPRYVKNGTLDGKVGLATDPTYPEANVKPGSYFQPIQAYSLKNRVERETSQLMAYYGQFNAARKGKAGDNDLTTAVEDNPYYDWENGVPRKDMVNTYVWTASGGTYQEQQSFTSMRQESEGGSYSFEWELGPFGELHATVASIGLMIEADLMGGTNWTVTVQKENEDEVGFGLDVMAEPTALLGKADDSPDAATPLPGKVDTYRFMSFYLAPETRNRDDFFEKVIDRAWLDTSSDPRAAALREAEAISTGKAVWRILHRVTYVNRVPPRFQTTPNDTVPIPLSEPTNLEQNAFVLELVKIALSNKDTPTPAEIGAAIDTVLQTDLAKILPWWAEFYKAAQVVNSAAWETYSLIRKNLFAYVNQYYEASEAV